MECVLSVIQSAGEYRIPVFISDDSADDTNVATVNRLRTLYPHIRHFRNHDNLGIDRNIIHSADVCSCRYAWLLGEDDRLLPGAIPNVLKVIKNTAPYFIYVNYRSADSSMKIILKDRSLPLQQDDIVESSEFLSRDAWSMAFLGACVIRKECWNPVIPDRYIGTYYAHVGRVMEYLKGRSIFRIAEPLVLNRCGSPKTFSWIDSTFEVVTGWESLMKELEPVYGAEICQESVRSFERAHGLNSLYFLAYLRADSAFDSHMYKTKVRLSDKSVGYKIGARVISLTPTVFFRGIRFFLNQIRALRYGRL